MRIRALCCGLAAGLALAAAPSASAHRIHSALTEVRPNENTGELEIVHRVFFHDLEVALIESGMDDEAPPLGEIWLDSADRYVRDRFAIGIDGASLQLDYVGAEVDGQFAWIYYVTPMPDEYDGVTIDNRLLIDAFPDQANMTNVIRGETVRTILQVPGRRGSGRVDFPDR
ncbi:MULTISPECIES: DUF6702 family protein [Hyphobacterium]|uniref:DUF6702 family protein n=1 Tax=Hyphobacterium vulgare TaxID=1736751 RepID=A0ABV6ZT09_9PROT